MSKILHFIVVCDNCGTPKTLQHVCRRRLACHPALAGCRPHSPAVLLAGVPSLAGLGSASGIGCRRSLDQDLHSAPVHLHLVFNRDLRPAHADLGNLLFLVPVSFLSIAPGNKPVSRQPITYPFPGHRLIRRHAIQWIAAFPAAACLPFKVSAGAICTSPPQTPARPRRVLSSSASPMMSFLLTPIISIPIPTTRRLTTPPTTATATATVVIATGTATAGGAVGIHRHRRLAAVAGAAGAAHLPGADTHQHHHPAAAVAAEIGPARGLRPAATGGGGDGGINILPRGVLLRSHAEPPAPAPAPAPAARGTPLQSCRRPRSARPQRP